jgi:hypothetical protein
MSHPDQLRQYARDCLRLAQDVTSPELKIHLINMAEAWAALAVQSERIAAMCATVTQEVASPPIAVQDQAAIAPAGGSAMPTLIPEQPPGPMAEPDVVEPKPDPQQT